MTTLDKPNPSPTELPLRPPQPRLDWVDNLRTLTILLVVNMHACVTYSHVGRWYFNAPPDPSIPEKIPFFIWQAHLQSFFMGLLFFIAGYYADRSLVKRGGAAFLRERAKRLGIPTVLYMLAIQPFILIVLNPDREPIGVVEYYRHALDHGRFLGHSGPMWFAFTLLIFSLIFAVVAPRLPRASAKGLNLKAGPIVGIGLLLGCLTFLVRTVQPQGSSILNFQLCYFSQYVVVFALGIYVSRRDGLNQLAKSQLSKKIGWCALIFGPIAWVGVVLASLPIPAHGPLPIDGGWNPLALSYALWEQLTGLGLGIGVMALCVRKLNVQTKFSSWLSDRSFGVYLLHPPVLVAISLWVQPFRSNPLVMTIVVTILAVIATFAFADLARRVPLLKTIL